MTADHPRPHRTADHPRPHRSTPHSVAQVDFSERRTVCRCGWETQGEPDAMAEAYQLHRVESGMRRGLLSGKSGRA